MTSGTLLHHNLGARLVAWHSDGTPVYGRRTFRPALDLQLMDDHLCG